MATLLKVLNNLADIKSAGGVALRVRTQVIAIAVGTGTSFAIRAALADLRRKEYLDKERAEERRQDLYDKGTQYAERNYETTAKKLSEEKRNGYKWETGNENVLNDNVQHNIRWAKEYIETLGGETVLIIPGIFDEKIPDDNHYEKVAYALAVFQDYDHLLRLEEALLVLYETQLEWAKFINKPNDIAHYVGLIRDCNLRLPVAKKMFAYKLDELVLSWTTLENVYRGMDIEEAKVQARRKLGEQPEWPKERSARLFGGRLHRID
jgi:hypothetical protein